MGDNEQRWYMWYSGSSAPPAGLAGVAPAAGSVGESKTLDLFKHSRQTLKHLPCG
jgi:hypothetical protein